MNAEVTILQRRVIALYQEQRAYLAGKPAAFLTDLQHQAGELRDDESFSVRVAAEINHACAAVILEERKTK